MREAKACYDYLMIIESETDLKFREVSQREGEHLLPDFFNPDHPPGLRTAFESIMPGNDTKAYAFPSVGALRHHILVCPEDGQYSAANLGADMRECLFATAQEIRFRYKHWEDSLDGAPLLVEHGAAPSRAAPNLATKDGCACMDYPHLHLIPFSSNVKVAFYYFCCEIGGPENLVLRDPADLEQLKGQPYLLLEPWMGSRRSMYIWKDPQEKFGRQFIRKAVWCFQQCGEDADKARQAFQNPGRAWDWRSNPGFDVVRETNALLQRMLSR